MFCKHCGKSLADSQAFCDVCGAPTADIPTEPAVSHGIHCPHCGSHDLQPITSTEVTTTSSSGFSATKGCLGYLLLGPFGILCGACGKSRTSTNSVLTRSGNNGSCSNFGPISVKSKRSTPSQNTTQCGLPIETHVIL